MVDSMNFRVQVLDSSGNFLFCFGENGDGTGQMARPKGVATDSHGNIYLADALFHVVQVFDREGRYLANFGGQGRGEGEFWMPAGIYIGPRHEFTWQTVTTQGFRSFNWKHNGYDPSTTTRSGIGPATADPPGNDLPERGELAAQSFGQRAGRGEGRLRSGDLHFLPHPPPQSALQPSLEQG